ncbi:MAG: restriction endonuclease subunit S, partial [Proteobacteria bacterium]|nr:restriction endonuclease subunit S [Pseudomonadota bacterium]
MHALRRVVIPQPTPDEQAAIVRFLEHANRKIDGFIRAKRKLIGLLNEQKQAIIHRAVTRGLDPHAPLKPSGIPWLGDIPKHWETRRLRFCIKGKLAYGANEAAEFDNPDWPRYLRITDFRSDGTLKPDTFRSLPPHIAKDYPVQDGDILFARSGATVGKAFLVRTDTANACYAGYLIRARPRPDVVLPEFLFAYTQSLAFAQWKDEIFSKATIQNIGADKYSNLVVPIPKIEEQKSILAHIAVETLPLNTAIARTERE